MFGKKYKKLFKKTKLDKVVYADMGKMLFVLGDDVYYKERKGAAAYNVKTLELLSRNDIPEIVEMIVF